MHSLDPECRYSVNSAASVAWISDGMCMIARSGSLAARVMAAALTLAPALHNMAAAS